MAPEARRRASSPEDILALAQTAALFARFDEAIAAIAALESGPALAPRTSRLFEKFIRRHPELS